MSLRQFSVQCIDLAYWDIFPHFEVTRFMLDTVRDSLETCFYSWDYHILHHFGYSFEVGFRVSYLRHWSVLYSNFLADYCWVEDSWLMMLDSLFGYALDIHTGAYPPLFSEIPICYWTAWLSLFMVVEMFGWFWQTLYCALDYPHWGIFPSGVANLWTRIFHVRPHSIGETRFLFVKI